MGVYLRQPKVTAYVGGKVSGTGVKMLSRADELIVVIDDQPQQALPYKKRRLHTSAVARLDSLVATTG